MCELCVRACHVSNVLYWPGHVDVQCDNQGVMRHSEEWMSVTDVSGGGGGGEGGRGNHSKKRENLTTTTKRRKKQKTLRADER